MGNHETSSEFQKEGTITKWEMFHTLADKYGKPDYQYTHHTPLQTQLYWEYHMWDQIQKKRWEFGLAGGSDPQNIGNDYPFEILRYKIPLFDRKKLTEEEWAYVSKDIHTLNRYMSKKAKGIT